MAEEGDELRCHRNDAHNWRCKKIALPGKLFCDIHFGKLPVAAAPVLSSDTISDNPPAPASPVSDQNGDAEIRVVGRDHLDRQKKRKHSWAVDMFEAYSAVDYVKKIKNIKGKKKKKRTRMIKELISDESNAGVSIQIQLEEKQDEQAKERKGKDKAEDNDIEKKKRRHKKKKNVGEENKEKMTTTVAAVASGEELTRELPYGRMAISLPPEPLKKPSAQPTVKAPPPVKLGLNRSSCRLVNRNCRTKNVDPLPITTVKAVPYAANARDKATPSGGARRRCHWCQKNSDVSLIKCLSCKKNSFCSDCIKKRCIDAKELEKRCIVCRGACECNLCMTSQRSDAGVMENSKKQKNVRDYSSFHYLINLVFPILEQINAEQRIELEMEAKLKGQTPSEVQIRQVEIGLKKQISCNKCSSLILDMHRSCSSCSYNLCLSCCQDSRSLMLAGTAPLSTEKSVSGDKELTEKKPADESMQKSDNLLCPSLELGGCAQSALALTCIFPLNFTMKLEKSAKEIILSNESAQNVDASLHCSLCSAMAKDGCNKKELLEASKRKHPGDNFLYSPSIHGDSRAVLVHFQKHWRNSHPVVVRDLLEITSDMAWDPIALFSNYLYTSLSRSDNDQEERDDPNYTDWYKVEFSSKDTFSESQLKGVHSSWETLTLKAKLSSVLSQRVFSDHYDEITDALPVQQYTHPVSGSLNLVANSAEDSPVLGFRSHVYITCGTAEEIRRGELVTELTYNSHDLVNTLVHASEFSWSSDEVDEIKTLMIMKRVKDTGGSLDDIIANNSTDSDPGSETESDTSVICSDTSDIPKNPVPNSKQSGGMLWDVFRRQDAPKLVEYIKKHSDELYVPHDSSKQVIDPNVLNGSFYLDLGHKMKLKNEFKIEPWTFTQKLGEAVIIPAGCPYQTKSLKSCMNVVVGFLSPENAGESIKLADKLEALSADHKAEPSKMKVQKMVINKLSDVIKEMHR